MKRDGSEIGDTLRLLRIDFFERFNAEKSGVGKNQSGLNG